jgi:hypothetical protein
MGINGFAVKKPPNTYNGTSEEWKALSQNQRRRIRKGPVIRERERASRKHPDAKAEVKEYRKRPYVKAAAYASALKRKQKRKELHTIKTNTVQGTCHTETVMVAVEVMDAVEVVDAVEVMDPVDVMDMVEVSDVVVCGV